MRRRLAVLLAALAIDAALGDLPNRLHPVAWFGRGTARLRPRLPHGTPRRDLLSGLFLATALPAGAALAGRAVARAARRLPPPLAIAAEGFALKQALAFRGLLGHGLAVERHLRTGDLEVARAAASHLVSRPVAALDEAATASAAVESVAENTSDSVVAPAFWYLLGGLPAAWAYRAVNTLDAMVGYRSFGLLGAPSARADDILNFVPARATALLLASAAPHPAAALRGARNDSGATASPNSGWPMAAAAHALGVRLEKQGHHVLNHAGRAPASGDIKRAAVLVSRAIARFAAAAGLALALLPRAHREAAP